MQYRANEGYLIDMTYATSDIHSILRQVSKPENENLVPSRYQQSVCAQ